jgi:hypothetical protein
MPIPAQLANSTTLRPVAASTRLIPRNPQFAVSEKLARGESRQAFLRNRTPSTITSHLYIRQAVVFPLDASTQAPLFYAQLFSTRFSTNDFFKMTALSKGPIHGLMFNELQAPIAIKKFGMQSLIDLMESKIPFPQNCFIVKRNYLESNRGKVTNFMKAVIEAMYCSR